VLQELPTTFYSHSAAACYNCGSVLQELPHQRRVLQEPPACSTFWPRATQRNSTLTWRQGATIAVACCKNYHISAACCNKIPLSLGGSVLQLRQRVARTTTSAPRVARTISWYSTLPHQRRELQEIKISARPRVHSSNSVVS
jgi:hypothetical protein